MSLCSSKWIDTSDTYSKDVSITPSSYSLVLSTHTNIYNTYCLHHIYPKRCIDFNGYIMSNNEKSDITGTLYITVFKIISLYNHAVCNSHTVYTMIENGTLVSLHNTDSLYYTLYHPGWYMITNESLIFTYINNTQLFSMQLYNKPFVIYIYV